MWSFQNPTLEKVQYQYENWFKIYNYFDNVMFLYECRCKTFCGARVVFTNYASKFSSSLSGSLLERFFWTIIWIFIDQSLHAIHCWMGNYLCYDYGISSKLIFAVSDGAVMNISKELAWGRLPFQYVFIGLAYWHAQD